MLQRTLTTEWKENPQNGRKYLPNTKSDKSLGSRIHEELKNLTAKR